MLNNTAYAVITTPPEQYEFMYSLKLPIHVYQRLLHSKNIEIELPTVTASEGFIYDHDDRIATLTSVGTIADTECYKLDNNNISLVFNGKLNKKLHAVGDMDALASELRSKTRRKERERSESKTKIITKPVDLMLPPDEQVVLPAAKRVKSEITSGNSKQVHAAGNQWLVARNMPPYITFNQIKIFFSGLTVINIYAHGYIPPPSSATTTSSDSTTKGVDIYIEFESINGASLGCYRSDECVTFNTTTSVPIRLEYVSNTEAFWAKGTCCSMARMPSLQSVITSKIPACVTQVCSLGPATAAQKWMFLENNALHPDSIVGFPGSNRAKNDLKLCKMEPYFYNSTVLLTGNTRTTASPQWGHANEYVTAIDNIIQQTKGVLHQVALAHSSYLLDTLRESNGGFIELVRVSSDDAAPKRVSSDDWMEILGRIKELYEILYILSVKQRDNLCILL